MEGYSLTMYTALTGCRKRKTAAFCFIFGDKSFYGGVCNFKYANGVIDAAWFCGGQLREHVAAHLTGGVL